MYRVLEKRVLVELLPPKTDMLGEFALPQGAIQSPSEGIVISVGSEVLDIKKGESVLFDKKFGVNFSENGKNYRILETRDILLIK